MRIMFVLPNPNVTQFPEGMLALRNITNTRLAYAVAQKYAIKIL